MRWLAFGMVALTLTGAAAAATELSVEGTRFTVNGKPTFLLGISYYGGLGAPEKSIQLDLDDMQKHGFNWFRVWGTWASFGKDVTAVDGQGNPREPYLGKLRWLVAECDRRGIVVDVTLSRGNGITGPERLQSAEFLRRGVQTIVTALKSQRNWYLDLANERNIKDKRFVSFEELIELRKLVRELDRSRLVTASHAGDMTKDELRRYLQEVRVDFIAPHRPRDARSPGQTSEQTTKYSEWMKELGRVVPVHYQEPFRRNYDPGHWEPKTDDFLLDLAQAKDGGAAGWCLHNGDQKHKPEGKPRRSFDMRDARLFDQLDAEEMGFIQRMKVAAAK